MSALTQQLEQLKQQQQELEERIQKEKETKQKLENESSIERLEALVQPLTDVLDRRAGWCNGRKSVREQRAIEYKHAMQQYNDHLIREPRPIHNPRTPPQKNKQLLEEEIYTTIISILKKQEKKIDEISSTVDKYFGNFNKRGLIKNYKKIL